VDPSYPRGYVQRVHINPSSQQGMYNGGMRIPVIKGGMYKGGTWIPIITGGMYTVDSSMLHFKLCCNSKGTSYHTV